MFNPIHDISVQLLGVLPLELNLLYFISDLFLLLVIIIAFIYIITLPFRLMRW